jgi:CPA1 family monovalent cation:H+ antiporter
LISAATRLQGIFFWNFLIYLIEGMVFLITGLQARTLITGISGMSVSELAISAAVVSAVVILARFVWMYPATYLPRWLIPAVRRRDPSPSWQSPFALAFTGVRGIVSLAAALATPLTTESGAPFPHRDLILFLTFSVILVTLVGQGLLLPSVIRWLGLANAGRQERHEDRAEEFIARRQAIEATIKRLDQLAVERGLPEEFGESLRALHRDRLRRAEHRSDGDESHMKLVEVYDEIEFTLIATERDLINDLYRRGKLKDEARRRIERELDLRDAHLTNLRAEE